MGEESTFTDKISRVFLNVAAVVLAVVVAFVFLFGFYDFFTGSVKNECQMTWMYEFPHFVKIPLGKEIEGKYPMYGLYIYAEGGQVETARREKYDGIPVLFLPGNAGSYKQVRSIASVALWKAIDNKNSFYFDFFTVDFNEEISGLYGNVLNRQLDYSRKIVDHIRSLYKDFHHVVVIGHSMGGVIAKTINAGEIKSHLIFTLASPHSRPVIIADPDFDLFYFQSQKNFTEMQDDDLKISVVSISGGESDLMVADKLALSSTNAIQTSTTSIPNTWISADHLCLLWCNQFVLVIVRILFDLVGFQKMGKYNGEDQGYLKITTKQEVIDSVLSYHLRKRSSGKSYHTAYPKDSLTKPTKADWEEMIVHKYCRSGSSRTSYVMFSMLTITEKVKGDPKSYGVTVYTNNTKPKSWIFGCTNQDFNNNVRYCSGVENLTPLGEILPNRHKVAHLAYDKIKKYSHIVVKTLARDSPFCIHIEVNDLREDPHPLSTKDFSTENRIFFNFSLNSWMRRVIAWRVEAKLAEGSTCSNQSENSVVIFRHDNFQTHSLIGNGSYGNLVIRFANWSAANASLIMYMDPECNYKISVTVAYLESAGQVFRTYFGLLPAYFASVILLSMFFQRHHEEWENFHLLLLKNAFELTFIPGLIVGGLLTFLPSDYFKAMDKNEVSIYLPLFCYLAAFLLVFVATAGGWYILIGSGNAVHAFFMKFISKRLGKIPDKVTDFAIDLTFAKFPIVISVFLISLSAATCGGLGICVGLGLYFIKIFKMYEDMLDDLLKGKIKSVQEGFSPLNFHQTIASLWLVVAALNIPSVIHWTRNFGFGQSPQWDMSLYISLMLTPVVAILWQDFVPKFNPTVWTFQRYLSYATGIFVIVWGTHRLYIISFFITLHLLTFAFTQLYSSLLDLTTKRSEDRQSEIRQSEDQQSGGQRGDQQSEDQQSEDQQSEDQQSEDQQSEDDQSEDRRSEDQQSDGRKSEDLLDSVPNSLSTSPSDSPDHRSSEELVESTDSANQYEVELESDEVLTLKKNN